MKSTQKNTVIAFFWIWTLVFFGITITEILEIDTRLMGAHKILMTYLTVFLFLIYLAISTNLFAKSWQMQKFRIAETAFFVIGIGIFAGFFFVLEHRTALESLH